jgi:hypothetical protein
MITGWLGCVAVSALLVGTTTSLIIWAVLAVHEFGHWLTLEQPDYPVWIPGVGALLFQAPTRARTALAGGLIALPCTVAVSWIDPVAAAILCAFHLVALAPIPPFDGGWVTGSGWWSPLAALVLILTIGWGALPLVIPCILRVRQPQMQVRGALVAWVLLWAAWWGLALLAPWHIANPGSG